MRLKTLLITLITLMTMQPKVMSQNEAQKPKVLIAYFSWSGNTKKIAEQIKEITGGDLFEIETVTPYSTNYNKCVEDAKKEKEQNARPAIKNKVANMSEYDIVYIGYPNWWGTMPMPVLTFIDSYDFANKTLLPFCTHGGGGEQQCFKDFAKHTSKYTSKKGFLANGSSVDRAKPHVEKWIKEQVGVNK